MNVIKNGRMTLVTMGSKAEINLTKEEAMLEKVARTVNEYFRAKYSGDAGILWNVDTHQSIIYISCKKWGVSDYYAGVARDHADDPDYWTQIPPPPGYPDWLWNFIMQVVHSWTHYYNPNWGTSSAPSEPQVNVNIIQIPLRTNIQMEICIQLMKTLDMQASSF